MTECPSCGEPCAPGDAFCEACGKELAPAVDSGESPNVVMECLVCSADPAIAQPPEVTPEGYCGSCGRKVPSGRDHTELDLGLIAEIHRAVPVPLVLHGSSGVPDAGLAAAVAAGMTKINVATQLNKVFTGALRAYLAADPVVVDPRRYTAAARDAVATEVARLLGLLGAAG